MLKAIEFAVAFPLMKLVSARSSHMSRRSSNLMASAVSYYGAASLLQRNAHSRPLNLMLIKMVAVKVASIERARKRRCNGTFVEMDPSPHTSPSLCLIFCLPDLLKLNNASLTEQQEQQTSNV